MAPPSVSIVRSHFHCNVQSSIYCFFSSDMPPILNPMVTQTRISLVKTGLIIFGALAGFYLCAIPLMHDASDENDSEIVYQVYPAVEKIEKNNQHGLICPNGEEMEKVFQVRKQKLEEFCKSREESTQPLDWDKFNEYRHMNSAKYICLLKLC